MDTEHIDIALTRIDAKFNRDMFKLREEQAISYLQTLEDHVRFLQNKYPFDTAKFNDMRKEAVQTLKSIVYNPSPMKQHYHPGLKEFRCGNIDFLLFKFLNQHKFSTLIEEYDQYVKDNAFEVSIACRWLFIPYNEPDQLVYKESLTDSSNDSRKRQRDRDDDHEDDWL